jgi:exodeoxyribonuclease VII small subunit
VSKGAKATGSGTVKADELPFEEALKKLEAIVEDMEGGELPLEQLIAKFEEGTKLARVCQARLADAELKIKQLDKDADGQTVARTVTIAEDDAEKE